MNEAPIIIQPHMKVDNELKHTDIAAASLYSATVSIVNSERSSVWQRYNALLIANAVVFGFIGRGDLSTTYVVIGCAFGLILCAFWWSITQDGWRFFNAYCQMAQRFRFPKIDDDVNASQAMFQEFQARKPSLLIGRFYEGDSIRTAAAGVIILFGFVYSLLLTLRVLGKFGLVIV